MTSTSGQPKTKRLVGLKAIAQHMDRSERTICRYIARYALPVVRVGGLLEADPKELDKWRENGGNGA